MKGLVKCWLLVFFTLGISMSYADGHGENYYLVSGSGGPGFKSPEEIIAVLENGILPTFNALEKLQKDKVILAGGLPVGARSFVFIAKAKSHHALDKILRKLPAWGVLNWQVTALESFTGRKNQEVKILKQLKSQ